jgi:uncharacterized membrane protein
MSKDSLASIAVSSALTAVSTAIVCVVTMVFSIYVPQTRGFFNLGETMVYIVAVLFGPIIGCFSGGIGSMLADILLGYWYYAPATLVIKACEGGTVGLLGRVRPRFKPGLQWKAFTFCTGLAVGTLLAFIGSSYYSGTVELKLGIPPPEQPNVVFSVPVALWYALGILAVAFISLAGFVTEPELGWPIFAMLVGGTIMVTGYYVYQKFLLFALFGIGDVVAEAEIPFNIGQVLVGLIVAAPIVKIVQRSLPQLKR